MTISFVFGGWDGKKCLNDLHEFSTISKIWYNVSLGCVGDIPSPRYRLDACSVGNRLYFFGGVDSLQKKYSALYEFNLAGKQWKFVEVEGDSPSARSFLKLKEVDNRIILFGGVDDKKRNDIYSLQLLQSTSSRSRLKSNPSISVPSDHSMIEIKSTERQSPVAIL